MSSLTADDWSSQGRIHLASSRMADALACFQRATELEPAAAHHWARLARLQASLQNHDAAEAGFRRACELAPAELGYHLLLASTLREQNAPEAALDALSRAGAIDADNLTVAVGTALMLPPVYKDAADLASWRARYKLGVASLLARLPRLRARAREVLDLEWTNFYLAYQGRNDCELQTLYSEFLSALLQAAVPHLQAPTTPKRRSDGRISVAFVSSNFRTCTIGDYFLRWVTDLPRDRFHVSVVSTGAVYDDRSAEFARGADRFQKLDGDVESTAAAIRAAGFDAIVYPDVGMSRRSSLLSNMRLAPAQFSGWGHPVTTGSRFIDRYLSCAEMEPPDASSHYREKLALLPGIGVRYGAAEGASIGRNRLGVAPDAHVYICPQSPYKIHPDADAPLLAVMMGDPRAVLVLFSGDTRGQTDAFLERFSKGLRRLGLAPRAQIKLLPLLPRAQFLAVMGAADVMLDTLHWSGGNTSLDALSANLPIVTLPGEEMRGRQTSAMLRIVGVEELIARDVDDYVRIAVRIATDRSYRAELVRRIAKGLPRLFDRVEPVAALADLLAEECARSRSGSAPSRAGADDDAPPMPPG